MREGSLNRRSWASLTPSFGSCETFGKAGCLFFSVSKCGICKAARISLQPDKKDSFMACYTTSTLVRWLGPEWMQHCLTAGSCSAPANNQYEYYSRAYAPKAIHFCIRTYSDTDGICQLQDKWWQWWEQSLVRFWYNLTMIVLKSTRVRVVTYTFAIYNLDSLRIRLRCEQCLTRSAQTNWRYWLQ